MAALASNEKMSPDLFSCELLEANGSDLALLLKSRLNPEAWEESISANGSSNILDEGFGLLGSEKGTGSEGGALISGGIGWEIFLCFF